MITRQVIDLSTKLPHFPTTHVYIGLLLFFFIPPKSSTKRYNLLPLYQSVFLSFKSYHIQSSNSFHLSVFFPPHGIGHGDSLSLSLSLSRQVLLQHQILVNGSKHRFLIHFIRHKYLFNFIFTNKNKIFLNIILEKI